MKVALFVEGKNEASGEDDARGYRTSGRCQVKSCLKMGAGLLS